MKVKSESEVAQSCLLATPQTAAHQAPLPMGFSRQEYWSGVPLPSLLVPRPGVKLMPPALEEQTLNHWTIREVPVLLF